VFVYSGFVCSGLEWSGKFVFGISYMLQLKVKFSLSNSMEAYVGDEVYLHSFLTSALD
jgi:hypothetical protein